MSHPIYFITALLTMFILNTSAQNINITNLKNQKKDSIVHFALDQLKKKGIQINNLKDKSNRVMANNKSIYVIFNMGFKKTTDGKAYENYDLKIQFYPESITVSPNDSELKSVEYKLTAKENKEVAFVLSDMHCSFAEDERITIESKPDYYELTFSRSLSKGSECYAVDKKTGKRSLLWHEHPNRNTDFKITPSVDEFIEIK